MMEKNRVGAHVSAKGGLVLRWNRSFENDKLSFIAFGLRLTNKTFNVYTGTADIIKNP